MGVTIKKIAELAGVSRGTVDRVIHNRYGVDPKIKMQVRAIMDELGYRPNLVAQALKRSQNPLLFGAIVPDFSNPFFQNIARGLRDAEEAYESYGVKLEIIGMQSVSAEENIACIDRLMREHSDIKGLLIAGINEEPVRQRINAIPGSIPVMTYNTDVSDTKRICFVGEDHIAAGRTSAAFAAPLLPRGARVATFAGNHGMLAHMERIHGFREKMAELRPDVVVAQPLYLHESDKSNRLSYKLGLKLLAEHQTGCFFCAGRGSNGLGKALRETGEAGRVHMVVFDLTSETFDDVRDGVADFAVCQDAYIQGYIPVKLMYEYHAFGSIPRWEYLHTNIDIRVKDNMDFKGFELFSGLYKG